MNRRGFLTGLAAALAAPAIVRFENLMPVRGIIVPIPRPGVRYSMRSIHLPPGNFSLDEIAAIIANHRYEYPSSPISRIVGAGPSRNPVLRESL